MAELPKSMNRLRKLLVATMALCTAAGAAAQFFDPFDGSEIEGWFTMSGDGVAKIEFVPRDGFARMEIDGTPDRHNVWWTLIKRDVSRFVDLEKLRDPAYELRVEARVRVSHAPRRLNFMINTQRTVDFHQHLREYDIPDTDNWHTISMTTRDLDARPGDTLFVQLAATDWGEGKYHVDVDYYRADVVRRDKAKPDVGEPLMYHPPVRDVAEYAHHVSVAEDSVVDTQFPDVNFNDWQVEDEGGTVRLLAIGGTQQAVLRWDLSAFRGAKAEGAGVLEVTTWAAPRGGSYVATYGEDLGIEFGKIRVFEILAGDPTWEQETVTYQKLLDGQDPAEVFNSQTTIDLDLAPKRGQKTYLTLPRPVMQRLIDGRTKGLVIRPLGAMAASIYASESGDAGPKLHFTTKR